MRSSRRPIPMSRINLPLPVHETEILWRYFDGVSQALAARFEEGSSPGEENLTFLLCELLDQGKTSRHLLAYPLAMAKDDLAKSDAGVTLDISFETHTHTKPFEHRYSGADLGLVFEVDHPYIGKFKKAVLLQAKRLAAGSRKGFSLNSPFDNFDFDQRDFLVELERRFSVNRAIVYLWYAPTSKAFVGEDAAAIRAMEAFNRPPLESLLIRGPYPEIFSVKYPHVPDDPGWRSSQPGTRFSELDTVCRLTRHKVVPRLSKLYETRYPSHVYGYGYRDFEPFADLFLLGLTPEYIGDSSDSWIKLARGKKVAVPPLAAAAQGKDQSAIEMPETAPAPRHSIVVTLRSTLPTLEATPDEAKKDE